ncbi:MAG: hypothetical protein Q4F84_10860, partial [Fibrobacter sp.]|nr:hypothetical protein [Fibrobacter sp.]
MTTRSAEKSVEIFEERLKKNPNSWVFSRLADAYREEGDFPKAIEVCLNGLQIHPEYVTGRLILGNCYLRQENYDQAMDEFKKICTVDRQNRVAIKSLAEIFTQKGDEQKANELYAVLYKIDPAGSAVLKPGMHLPSEKSLLEILEIDPDLGDSQEVPGGMPQEIMDNIPQDDIANAVTTVQPSVDQYDPDFVPQEPAHSDLDSLEQYTDLTEAIPGASIPNSS